MTGSPRHEDALEHAVVCGGTPDEWLAMSSREWTERFATVALGVGSVGARWVTLLPHHGEPLSVSAMTQFDATLEATGKVEQVDGAGHRRWVWRRDDGLTVCVDPSPDGHARFAGVVEGMRRAGADITEDSLASWLLHPVESEPDLALILGPPDTVPPSLVWELAYAELVFLDIAWGALQPGHLEMAVADFNRRHRRFGGLDS
ncbi:MAG: undecaprenyl diphosphate synthase family protein [Ilumatobacteraceae bacterium]